MGQELSRLLGARGETTRVVVQRGQDVILAVVAINGLRLLVSQGVGGVVRGIITAIRGIPGVNPVIEMVLNREVKGAMQLLGGGSGSGQAKVTPIPTKGLSHDELMKELLSMHEVETHAEEGKAFAYVYTTDSQMKQHVDSLKEMFRKYSEKTFHPSEDHEKFLADVYDLFMHGNALNPIVFPSLRKFEVETVSMTANMLNAPPEASGSLTSGGTESILMAIKAYRDRARKLCPHITKPEMIAPQTIHPAFEKAAHYFDVKMVHIPICDDFRANVAAMKKAINRNTILLLASAPQYCHGVVDPIEEISQLALSKGLPFHVDACFGGFMLPWIEKLGHKIPVFDFRAPGVTSMSADIHKYGYGAKGSSVVVYRNAELRSHQFFAYSEWPGGLFCSPSMAGTRPGGNLAQAWATLMSMGEDGYLNLAKQTFETTLKMQEAVKAAGLVVLGKPCMTSFSFASPDPEVNILSVADCMEMPGRGWKMERQQNPASLHCTVMPQHALSVDKFVEDVKASVQMVKTKGLKADEGTAAMYGMIGHIPDKALVSDFVLKFFGELYTNK